MSNKRIRKKQTQNWGNCPLCGKPLPKEPGKSVVGSSGRAVCTRCLKTVWRLAARPKEATPSHFLPDIRTPAQIVAELDRSIIDQDEAKWAVAAFPPLRRHHPQRERLPRPGRRRHGK